MEVEEHRCLICGEFPREIINTHKINTLIGRNSAVRGGDDWCEMYCTCSPETEERFLAEFRNSMDIG